MFEDGSRLHVRTEINEKTIRGHKFVSVIERPGGAAQFLRWEENPIQILGGIIPAEGLSIVCLLGTGWRDEVALHICQVDETSILLEVQPLKTSGAYKYMDDTITVEINQSVVFAEDHERYDSAKRYEVGYWEKWDDFTKYLEEQNKKRGTGAPFERLESDVKNAVRNAHFIDYPDLHVFD